MSLQKAAQEKFGIKPKIRGGKPGDLAVFVDGKEVFGYKKEGAMPGTEELLRRMAAVTA